MLSVKLNVTYKRLITRNYIFDILPRHSETRSISAIPIDKIPVAVGHIKFLHTRIYTQHRILYDDAWA